MAQIHEFPRMRSPRSAADGDRRTAWSLANLAMPGYSVCEEDERGWLEDGTVPVGPLPSPMELASKIAAALEAERKRTTAEIVFAMGPARPYSRGDHVRVMDRQSRHYGKSAIVWFVRDGRVMVAMEEPSSIGGSITDSFIPEHLERLEDPTPMNLERAVLLRFMRENAQMNDNLSSTQERCTVLLLATRAMRQRITELGGEDPGPP